MTIVCVATELVYPGRNRIRMPMEPVQREKVKIECSYIRRSLGSPGPDHKQGRHMPRALGRGSMGLLGAKGASWVHYQIVVTY